MKKWFCGIWPIEPSALASRAITSATVPAHTPAPPNSLGTVIASKARVGDQVQFPIRKHALAITQHRVVGDLRRSFASGGDRLGVIADDMGGGQTRRRRAEFGFRFEITITFGRSADICEYPGREGKAERRQLQACRGGATPLSA